MSLEEIQITSTHAYVLLLEWGIGHGVLGSLIGEQRT